MQRPYVANRELGVGGGAALLVIDPQVDFHPGGSLGIAGADQDATRLAKFILEDLDAIEEIYVSLDTHQQQHIAHAAFWRGGENENERPKPFSTITVADVRSGRWVPTNRKFNDWCLEYVLKLEAAGRCLTIWPDHCLLGSPGHSVVEVLRKAFTAWEEKHGRNVTYILKGTNSLTENYSAFRAEVPHPEDSSTRLNQALVDDLKRHRMVIVAGQALSHCVGNSLNDLAQCWNSKRLADLVLLQDCTSSVEGFQKDGDAFLKQFHEQGLTLTDTQGWNWALEFGKRPNRPVSRKRISQIVREAFSFMQALGGYTWRQQDDEVKTRGRHNIRTSKRRSDNTMVAWSRPV